MQLEIITILIPPRMWLDVRHDGTRLKCVISINGTLVHLEAIEVTHAGRDRTQVAVSVRDEEDFALICQFGSEGKLETTDINGKSYVLVATPFA